MSGSRPRAIASRCASSWIGTIETADAIERLIAPRSHLPCRRRGSGSSEPLEVDEVIPNLRIPRCKFPDQARPFCRGRGQNPKEISPEWLGEVCRFHRD